MRLRSIFWIPMELYFLNTLLYSISVRFDCIQWCCFGGHAMKKKVFVSSDKLWAIQMLKRVHLSNSFTTSLDDLLCISWIGAHRCNMCIFFVTWIHQFPLWETKKDRHTERTSGRHNFLLYWCSLHSFDLHITIKHHKANHTPLVNAKWKHNAGKSNRHIPTLEIRYETNMRAWCIMCAPRRYDGRLMFIVVLISRRMCSAKYHICVWFLYSIPSYLTGSVNFNVSLIFVYWDFSSGNVSCF